MVILSLWTGAHRWVLRLVAFSVESASVVSILHSKWGCWIFMCMCVNKNIFNSFAHTLQLSNSIIDMLTALRSLVRWIEKISSFRQLRGETSWKISLLSLKMSYWEAPQANKQGNSSLGWVLEGINWFIWFFRSSTDRV